ncbi:MAG TPA: 50S ribosomal protein L9 [Rhodanobacteraceae bacterium]|nr:50S ribosomal protein L9 [Rhodanobacteraceae bacterium]
MDLILLENVRGLGHLGDKVKVKPGYGRNYLVPQGKATRATPANLAEFEARRAEYEARASQNLAGANQRLAEFAEASVTISANASAEGKLFGSVGPRDIAEAFSAQGLKLNKSEVILADGPLRAVGEYEVQLALHADVHTAVKVVVVGAHQG